MSSSQQKYLMTSSDGQEEEFRTISDGAALSKMITKATGSTEDWDLWYVGAAQNEHIAAIRQDDEGLSIEARI